MKFPTFLVLTSLLLSPALHAAEPVDEALPVTAEQWAARMLDFTRNADALTDPRLFVPYANAMMEPAYWFQMASQMMNPQGAARMMASLADPRAMQNFMQFARPEVYTGWMRAMLDPAFSAALMEQALAPDRVGRWMTLPADPAWPALMGQAHNPAWPMQWMAAFMQAGSAAQRP